MCSYQMLQKSLASNVRRSLIRSYHPKWTLSSYLRRLNSQNAGGIPAPGVSVLPLGQDGPTEDKGKGKGENSEATFKSTFFKMLESVATTFASIAVIGYEQA